MPDIITIAPYPGGKNRNTLALTEPFIPYKDIETYIEPFFWLVGGWI